MAAGLLIVQSLFVQEDLKLGFVSVAFWVCSENLCCLHFSQIISVLLSPLDVDNRFDQGYTEDCENMIQR